MVGRRKKFNGESHVTTADTSHVIALIAPSMETLFMDCRQIVREINS
jgi:hypothetical protein